MSRDLVVLAAGLAAAFVLPFLLARMESDLQDMRSGHEPASCGDAATAAPTPLGTAVAPRLPLRKARARR